MLMNTHTDTVLAYAARYALRYGCASYQDGVRDCVRAVEKNLKLVLS